MHGLEAKYSDQVTFAYLDIDDGNTFRFKQALGFRYQPHLFLLDGEGKIIEQWVGSVSEELLEDAILTALE